MALGVASPTGEMHRHGGLSATADGEWVLAVREIHHEGSARPLRSVVALVDPRCGSPCETTLLGGHDFFGTPRPHPTGNRLAVVAWDHPDMPWDASTVFVQPLGRVACSVHEHDALQAVGPSQRVAGGVAESVGQPAWNRDGATALRLGSPRLVAALPAACVPRCGGRVHPDDQQGCRVPRARLGTRPADHGGDGRRDPRGTDDRIGTGCARVLGHRRRYGVPAGTRAAVRLHRRAVRGR